MKLVPILLLLPALANAEVLVEARSPSGLRIELHSEAGPCVDGARVAMWVKDSVRIPGCYKVEGGVVKVGWLDGDANTLDARHFKRPETL